MRPVLRHPALKRTTQPARTTGKQPCKHCNSLFSSLAVHQPVCPRNLRECTHCRVQVQARLMQAHLKNCPLSRSQFRIQSRKLKKTNQAEEETVVSPLAHSAANIAAEEDSGTLRPPLANSEAALGADRSPARERGRDSISRVRPEWFRQPPRRVLPMVIETEQEAERNRRMYRLEERNQHRERQMRALLQRQRRDWMQARQRQTLQRESRQVRQGNWDSSNSRALEEAALRAREQIEHSRRIGEERERQRQRALEEARERERQLQRQQQRQREQQRQRQRELQRERQRQREREREQQGLQGWRQSMRITSMEEQLYNRQVEQILQSGVQNHLPIIETYINQLRSLQNLVIQIEMGIPEELGAIYRMRVRAVQATIINSLSNIITEQITQQAAQKKVGLTPEEIEAMFPVGLALVAVDDCPICLMEVEKFQEIRELPCEHCFHRNCIDEWFKKNSNCPKCRKKYEAD